MSTTYVGFWRAAPGAEEAAQEVIRETGAFPEAFREKVRAFVTSLPGTCRLVGSWPISGDAAPSVIVVEAESYADLVHINQYYNGWIWFDWHPSSTVARD